MARPAPRAMRLGIARRTVEGEEVVLEDFDAFEARRAMAASFTPKLPLINTVAAGVTGRQPKRCTFDPHRQGSPAPTLVRCQLLTAHHEAQDHFNDVLAERAQRIRRAEVASEDF
jgi:hypothetical protein